MRSRQVDYATLYAHAQAALDARDDAANAREIEAAELRRKLDQAENSIEALGGERDKLVLRLERAETTCAHIFARDAGATRC